MNPAHRSTRAGSPSFFRKWASLFVLSLALAIIIIDTTLLNVSLRTIIADLHTDLQHLQWVISAYSLVLAAFTITGGRLGDLYGRKRMFMLGAVIFAVGSFLAAVSPNFTVLLLGESVIEGLGAALMMPATASLVVSNFFGRDRAIAFGIWGGVAAASSAIGPIVGGFLTTHFSWRWGFLINVFVAGLVLLGSLLVQEAKDPAERPSLDWIGVILSSLGLTSIVFAIIEASTYGWWGSKQAFILGGVTIVPGPLSVVPYAFAAGVALMTGFLLWERRVERRGRKPLVSIGVFANRQFSSGVATMSILSLGQAGIIFSLPIFLQSVRGLDAFHTGLSLLPMSVMLLVSAPLSGFLVRFVTAKRLIQTGVMLDLLAVFTLRASISADASPWSLAPGLLLYGTGMGLIMAQISNLILSALPVTQAGEASGLNNTTRQIGQTLGSAVIGSVVVTILTGGIASSIAASAVIPPDLKPALTAQMQQRMKAMDAAGAPDEGANALPPQVTAELKDLSIRSMVDANRQALLYAAIFVFFGVLASFTLPNVRIAERQPAPARQNAA
jgi:EmrB/QacA subfamily drug resistance transporter